MGDKLEKRLCVDSAIVKRAKSYMRKSKTNL